MKKPLTSIYPGFIVVITFLMGMPAYGRGQTDCRRLSLAECVDTALARNPSLAAAALDVEKARIMKGTAFDAPYTGITLKQETTGGGGPENGVLFSQDFDFPTVYTARHRQLDALYHLEQNRFNLQSQEVARKVEAAYHTLLYQEELLRINDRLAAVYEQFLHIAGIRLQEGETGVLEVMNAERMLEKNRMERSALEADLADGVTALRGLLCSDCDILPADTVFSQIPYAEGRPYDFAATLRGAEAQGLLAVADREIALAKNQFLPGISLGATVQALIKSFNPYHIERERFRQGNFMGFEVGISVPLFFGAQQSRLKAANAEKAAVMLRNEYAGAEAATEVARLRQRLASISERLDQFHAASIPRADEIRRVAEVSYNYGEIDYLEYIANIETAYAVYREFADTVNEYNQTVIQLKEITAQ